jgi:hypothetical protein
MAGTRETDPRDGGAESGSPDLAFLSLRVFCGGHHLGMAHQSFRDDPDRIGSRSFLFFLGQRKDTGKHGVGEPFGRGEDPASLESGILCHADKTASAHAIGGFLPDFGRVPGPCASSALSQFTRAGRFRADGPSWPRCSAVFP